MELQERLKFMNNFNLKVYEFEENHNQDFLYFMKELYQDSKHIEPYMQNIKKIKNKNNPSFKFIKIKNFIAYQGDKVLGHISAMIDKRLGGNIGLIGFYECLDNQELSKRLIEEAVNYLKENGYYIIRAPIDLTIWHPYRFVVDQKNTFILEPITKKYYIKHFIDYGFQQVAEYESGQRIDYQTILPYTKLAHDYLLKNGFRIEELKKEKFDEINLLIYELAKKTFTDSWSYVEISKEEYIYLYGETKDLFANLLVEVIYNPQKEAIGFCSSIFDPIDKDTMVIKSIAVLPEYQNMKVGAALIYSQHKKAYDRGISKIIYALVRIGNTVTKLPYPGIEVIRKYIALEKKFN